MLNEAARRALLNVRVLFGALTGGIVVFGGVVIYLLGSGGYVPPVATAGSYLVPLAGVFAVAALLSAPFIERMLRQIPDGATDQEALSRFQTSSIIGFAIREAAALFALMTSLITGRLQWGLGLAGVAVLGMLLALPGESRLRAFLDEWRRRSGS